jgi:hypothetical protein
MDFLHFCKRWCSMGWDGSGNGGGIIKADRGRRNELIRRAGGPRGARAMHRTAEHSRASRRFYGAGACAFGKPGRAGLWLVLF